MHRGDWRLLLALLASLFLGMLVVDAHRCQCPDPVCPWVQLFPLHDPGAKTGPSIPQGHSPIPVRLRAPSI